MREYAIREDDLSGSAVAALLTLHLQAMHARSSARQPYRANGFAECGPFGDYQTDPFSIFMTRCL